MRKGLIFISACTIVLLLAMVPLTNASTISKESDVIEVTCYVEGKKTTTNLPVETIESVIELGKSHKDDFLTIYNKYSTKEEVDLAFENLQPFFEALVSNQLTTKTVNELNDLFHKIRNKIRKPRVNPSKYLNGGEGDPQPGGNQNGVPTPLFGNACCGIFNVGVGSIGFTLGTNTILPTIGLDLFTTWFDHGSTVSIGLAGFSTSLFQPEFGYILGFCGVMIVTPIMILGLTFQTGFSALYLGCSLGPV